MSIIFIAPIEKLSQRHFQASHSNTNKS